MESQRSDHQIRVNLSQDQKLAVYEALLEQSEEGKLKKGTLTRVANTFSICVRTVSRICKQAKENTRDGEMANVPPRFNRRTGRVGRKRIQLDPNQVRELEFRRRRNIRSMAVGLGMKKSTLHRRVKEGALVPVTSPLKPHLTDENKVTRLRFCLSMINPISIDSSPLFHHMFDYVHIDEKLFYLTKETERYYKLPGEDTPYRTCRSKRFIPKVMFLADVARPRHDDQGNVLFSEKIGIFPFVFKEPAKRRSKNRAAGTLETKPILSITRDVVRSTLIEKVLPKIRSKWPSFASRTIYIQQDNAKPHISADVEELKQAAVKDGFNFHLQCQPPNSPDLNVLDLGYFRAIQSLQYEKAPRSIDELVNVVIQSFDELEPECLNNVFLSLHMFMAEIIKKSGGNNFPNPHIGKARLDHDGRLPLCLGCDIEVVREAQRSISGI